MMEGKASDSHSTLQPRKCLAVLGTMSDAGKSTITAGICRILTNGGKRVAPFKAQNMSNNSAPALLSHNQPNMLKTEDSNGNPIPIIEEGSSSTRVGGYGEIGVAQALQAEACKLIPRVEMNPVLLKSGGKRSSDGAYLCSVHVLGKQIATEDYKSLGNRTTSLLEMVTQSISDLQTLTEASIVIIEGAGSCTELNLMERDIVNIPLVRKLNCPWLLVSNIDPGGVFAQIVGTKACLSSTDWDLCVGVVVNNLRGDVQYFEPGPSMLESMIDKPIFVIPHLYNIDLPEEDGLGVERRLSKEHLYDIQHHDARKQTKAEEEEKPIVVVVVAYPHVSMTDDILPIERDARFTVQWRRENIPQFYPHTTCIILPGSRLSLSDLIWLTDKTKWGECIKSHVKAGGHVLGLCGGYQMLGLLLDDSLLGVEGVKEKRNGLGLLPVITHLEPATLKVIQPQSATILRYEKKCNHNNDDENNDVWVLKEGNGISVQGFELHCGQTEIITSDKVYPLLHLDTTKKEEGLRCGNIRATYLHGILKTAVARRILLCGDDNLDHDERIAREKDLIIDKSMNDPLDRFADHLEKHGLDFTTITKLANV